MSFGSLKTRWLHGVSWTWINENYRAHLPANLAATVMNIESRDRFHSKQGRSTARVVLHGSEHPLPVYLKRHYDLPWPARVAALVLPAGRHSPAAAEWQHLERVRNLGINVPDVVATGECIGPGARLQSFLMLAELTGSTALNELLPQLAVRLDPSGFALLKRRVVIEVARIVATLHRACVFHKDLYLCHFFLDPGRALPASGPPGLTLIDLHRLKQHRYLADWWRWKDLAQLLYSTDGVAGITPRDCARFWKCYRRLTGIKRPALDAWIVRFRTARYREHNRKRR